MENKEIGKSSDDSRDSSRIDDVREESVNQSLLEADIKKIIDDLDVQFVESPEDDDAQSAATTSSVPPLQLEKSRKFKAHGAPDRGKKYKGRSSKARAETLSTLSEATTVVNQWPMKITAHHLKSEHFDWPQYCNENVSPQNVNDRDTYMNQVVNERDVYYPEKDEVTELTTSETIQSSFERTEQSSSLRQPLTPSADLWSPVANTQPFATSDRQEQQWPQYPAATREHCQDLRQNQINLNANCQKEAVQGMQNTMQPPMVEYPQHGYCNQQAPRPEDRQTYHQNTFPTDEQGNTFQKCYYHYVDYDKQPQHDQPRLPQSQMKENVDRYNCTHKVFSPENEPERKRKRSSLTDFLWRKKRNSTQNGSDASEIVPQLYKASIRPGAVPNRFTFRAVTGAECCCTVPCKPPRCQERQDVQKRCTCQVGNICDENGNNAPSCLAKKGKKVDTKEKSSLVRMDANGCQCCSPCDCTPKIETRQCCETTNVHRDDEVKLKAYYSDMGHGYISQGSVPEKVDIYCFDQLNTGFFRTSDHPPPLYADIAIQRTEKYATVFWAEIFGLVNVVTAFVIAMILQTFKFILQGIIRPLMIGIVQLLSDYLIKPLLTLLYNGFTQPISIFLYNVVSSIRDVLQPMAKGIGYFVELVAVVLRAIRLVEVKNVTNIAPCGSEQMKC